MPLPPHASAESPIPVQATRSTTLRSTTLAGRLGRGTALGLLLTFGMRLPPAHAQQPPTVEENRESAPAATGRNPRPFGIMTGADGLTGLRDSEAPGGTNPATGRAPLFGNGTVGQASGGEASGGESSAGANVSRLPRLPTGAASAGVGGGSNNRTPTNLLRQRAAPPRRFGSPVRPIIRAQTQRSVTDLRLTPVIQNPVSGVPLPTNFPLLGLQNPVGLLGFGLRRPIAADDAYAPLGIRLGTFTFLPAFTQSVGYDTNPDQITPRLARASAALRSEAELAFRSDWSSSEFAGELRGSYLDFPQNEPASRPNASGVTRLRIDATRETRFELETRFLVDTLRAGSPELNAAVASRPLFATYGATAGVLQNFGRVLVSLRGSLDRQVFEDARLADGTLIQQSLRDANQYGLRLRVGYEISPVITPFVDALADTRVYDTTIDQSGLRRDSDGIGLTAGATFNLARFVTGEVAAGVQHRTYVDPVLEPITAPLVSAALIWSVSPLTTVRLNHQTGVVETVVAGSSGIRTAVTTAELQHDLLRNLSITLGGAFLSNQYDGINLTERGFSAIARLDYRFNRWLAVRGSYIYQQLNSSTPGFDFEGSTVLIGVRINP